MLFCLSLLVVKYLFYRFFVVVFDDCCILERNFFLYIFCQFRKSFYFCTHETGRVVPAGYWRGPFGFHIWFCFEFLVGAFLIGFLMRDYKRGFSTGFGADFFLMLDTVENFFLKSLFCKKNCYYLCSRNASVTGCLEKKTRVIFEIFS